MNAVVTVPREGGSLVAFTAVEVKAHVQRVQQVMKAVMIDGTHYGKIPGTGDKKSLLKPGAEVLGMTFHIAPSYRIEDLSDHDSVRYRVTCTGTHQATGVVLGEGLGSASSNEEKYRWRKATRREWEATNEDRRRVKYGYDRSTREEYEIQQVRTEPADIDNTVLKMACKRAQVAMIINATACSDIFTQDLEDIPAEMVVGMVGGEEGEQRESPQRGKPATEAPRARSGSAGSGKATEKQVALVKRRLNDSGLPENEFLQHFGIDDVANLPFGKVDEALNHIKQAGG